MDVRLGQLLGQGSAMLSIKACEPFGQSRRSFSLASSGVIMRGFGLRSRSHCDATQPLDAPVTRPAIARATIRLRALLRAPQQSRHGPGNAGRDQTPQARPAIGDAPPSRCKPRAYVPDVPPPQVQNDLFWLGCA